MSMLSQPVTVGAAVLADVLYDRNADWLYMSVSSDGPGGDGEQTPEGHVFFFDEEDRIVGLDLNGPAHILAREGNIRITTPRGDVVTLRPEDLREALSERASTKAA